jgi:hypothetical protein
MYAIYLQHQPKDTVLEAILLKDGCFTNEGNCYKQEYGVTWYKPELFITYGLARNFAIQNSLRGKRYKIHKYTGPTENR